MRLPAGAPVRVYRNLIKGLFSVLHRGRVAAHRQRIVLKDVSFVVQPGGKRRAQATNVRNVHAFVCGSVMIGAAGQLKGAYHAITYNPFADKGFYDRDSGREVIAAEYVIMDARLGVFAVHPVYTRPE